MREGALLMLALLAGSEARAADEPEIYRCTQDDGTVAFQQLPCRPTSMRRDDASNADEPLSDDANYPQAATGSDGDASNSGRRSIPEATPPSEARRDTESQQPVPMSGDRTDCEKSARDAIDSIDAELQASGNAENDRARLDELLELTRQLRRCKQL